MSTIFSKIINREVTAQFVFEDDVCVVVMDKFPSVKGQTLVIPKVEMDYIFDLDNETYAHIFQVAKKVALASDKAFSTVRTCLIVEGFEVPHVHIKIYPMKEGERNLATVLKANEMAPDEVLEAEAKQISDALLSI